MLNILINIKPLLIKFIKLIQFIKYRFLGYSFSRDKIELFKHFLNFYSINLENRKKLIVNEKYFFGANIDNTKMFRIDINKFTAYEGYYVFNGRAPLLKFSNQIYSNPKIKLEDSYLYEFYKYFQPLNFGELYDLNQNNRLSQISSFQDFKPWIHSYPNNQIIDKGIFGPIDNQEILHRFLRIKNIQKNLKKYGYTPNEEDIIKGYLLISNSDYRFLITSGHHRVAALKTLNSYESQIHKEVIVRFEGERSNIKAFYEKDIKKWPAVKSKFCSIEEARELFYKYFNY